MSTSYIRRYSRRAIKFIARAAALGLIGTVALNANAQVEDSDAREAFKLLRSNDPAWRFEAIVKDYPGTLAAFEAQLALAEGEYRKIKGMHADGGDVAVYAKFIEKYAESGILRPMDPAVEARFSERIHDIFFDCIDRTGSIALAVNYFLAYPRGPHAAALREAIEGAIMGNNVDWDVYEVLEAYLSTDVEIANRAKLRSHVENGLYETLKSVGTEEDFNQYAKLFPNSKHNADLGKLTHREQFEASIDERRPYLLDEYIKNNPDSPFIDEARAKQKYLIESKNKYLAANRNGRILDLQDFIKAYPSSTYSVDAAKQIDRIKYDALSNSEKSTADYYMERIQAHEETIREGWVMRRDDHTLDWYNDELAKLLNRAGDRIIQREADQAPRSSLAAPGANLTKITVYKNTRDRRYHRSDCRELDIGNIPLSMQLAREEGLKPCAHCQP